MPDASHMMAQGLSARGLCLERGDARLLTDLSFTLPATGISIVMGPNGAGKSLLLRVLHGLVAPNSGAVLWPEGREQTRQAMVFQRPMMLRRTVEGNLKFSLKNKGSRDQKIIRDLLETAGLSGRARHPARTLSGGEQQRLALACALAGSPEILFLDEPTAHLDPASTARIETIVQDVAATGTKIVFVTHDIGQAKRLADDVLFLHQGQLAEQRPAAAFFQRPESEAARAFLSGHLFTD